MSIDDRTPLPVLDSTLPLPVALIVAGLDALLVLVVGGLALGRGVPAAVPQLDPQAADAAPCTAASSPSRPSSWSTRASPSPRYPLRRKNPFVISSDTAGMSARPTTTPHSAPDIQ